MSKVLGQQVGKAFLEALGLQDRGVRSLCIRMAVYEPVTITVEMEGLEIPNGPSGLINAATLFREYELTERVLTDGEVRVPDPEDLPIQEANSHEA